LHQFYFKRQNRSTKVGTGTISRGEAGLIVTAVGITSGALTYDIDKAIIIMVALTTIVTPLPGSREPIPKNSQKIRKLSDETVIGINRHLVNLILIHILLKSNQDIPKSPFAFAGLFLGRTRYDTGYRLANQSCTFW
jgi:Kef-type K+ transport system membrane component KefB